MLMNILVINKFQSIPSFQYTVTTMIFSLSNIKAPCRQAVKFSAFTFFTLIFCPFSCHSLCIPGVNTTDSFSSPIADTFTFPVNRVVNILSSLSYAFILNEVPNTRVRTPPRLHDKRMCRIRFYLKVRFSL